MTWYRLVMSGCLRRPLRSALTAAGVAIAIAAAFSLLAFHSGYRRGLEREIERLGAHILVVPKGCPYEAASLALHGANWPCYLKASYLEEVRSVPGISAAAPALMAAFHAHAGQHTVYLGMDTNMLTLKPGWRISGAFPAAGEILVGAEAARRFGWKIAELVKLPGLDGPTAKVSGVLAPTQSSEDAFIFLPLDDAQRLFRHPHELTHVLVRLKDPNRLDNVVTALRGCDAGMNMNVVPLAHLFRTIQSLLNSTRWFLATATAIALMAAGAGVSATLLIAVNERSREIGVMRALGASQGHVFLLFLLESSLICLVGAAAGVLAAFATTSQVETWLRTKLPFTPVGDLLSWDWRIAAGCLALSLTIGCLASLPPCSRAARLPPIRAMKENGMGT